jgi:Histone H1-like nucleoprotein HC2
MPPAARKTTAKKATAEKATARKATAKKTTAKKATAKSTTAKSTTAKSTTARKATAKKATAKRAAPPAASASAAYAGAEAAATAAASSAQSGVEDAVVRIRELQGLLLETARRGGTSYLQAYETSLASMLALTESAAESSQLSWAITLANNYAEFVKRVNDAVMKAGRHALG